MVEIWDEKGPHGFREDFRFSISWRGNFFNYNDGHVGKLQRTKQDAEKMPRKKKDLISLLDLFLVPLNQFLAGWSGWSANLTQTHQRKTQSVAPAILLIHCQLLAVSSVLPSVAWTIWGVKREAAFNPNKKTFLDILGDVGGSIFPELCKKKQHKTPQISAPECWQTWDGHCWS